MTATRVSLIQALATGGDVAWLELDQVYRPLIFHWLRRYQVQSCDSEDITQEVMAVVSRRIHDFRHNGRVGAFRNWLRTITVHTARKYLDKGNRQPQATGNSAVREMLEQLESDRSELSQQFDEQHDRFILQQLLDRVASRFQPATMEAFRRHAIEGQEAVEVAAQLGIKPQTVYVAKARVMHALRELATGLFDEFENFV